MGLDMFLTKKTYIGAEYEHRKVKGSVKITIEGKPVNIDFKRISYIEERVGYWRKANQIHKWFVDNVQEGVDNCGEYAVSFKDLQKLKADCEAVLKEPVAAEQTLPTAKGFFFGGTDYDEYYLEQIQNTLDIITPLLAEAVEYDGKKYMPEEVYYSSSW